MESIEGCWCFVMEWCGATAGCLSMYYPAREVVARRSSASCFPFVVIARPACLRQWKYVGIISENKLIGGFAIESCCCHAALCFVPPPAVVRDASASAGSPLSEHGPAKPCSRWINLTSYLRYTGIAGDPQKRRGGGRSLTSR